MILNGVNGTMKGHVFDPEKPESMPTFIRRKGMEEQKRWAARETERYTVVELCKTCGRALIAEEVLAHRLNHVPTHLRPLARMIADLNAEDRAELLKIVKKV